MTIKRQPNESLDVIKLQYIENVVSYLSANTQLRKTCFTPQAMMLLFVVRIFA